MTSTPSALILTFLIVFFGQGTVFGQNLVQNRYGKKHRAHIGAKAGIINRTTLRVDSMDYETKVGLSGQVFVDMPLTSKGLIGITIDLHDINVRRHRQVVLDVGMTLKFPIYGKRNRPAVRPGIGVGYAMLAKVSDIESSTYLSVRALCEMVFYSDRKFAWVGELAVYGYPTGGNYDSDISYGPVVLIRLGVVY